DACGQERRRHQGLAHATLRRFCSLPSAGQVEHVAVVVRSVCAAGRRRGRDVHLPAPPSRAYRSRTPHRGAASTGAGAARRRPARRGAMTLFLLLPAVLVVVSLAFLLLPLWRARRSGVPSERSANLSIYRDQFTELERDLAA